MRLSRCSFHSCKYFWRQHTALGTTINKAMMYEKHRPHTKQTETERKRPSGGQRTKTSLTVTIFITIMTRRLSKTILKSHLVWLKQQRNIWKRQRWHSPEDGCRRLKGLKPYESRPLLLYNWNEPPNSILLNSSCSAAPPPPHALSLSHTVKPVSFPVPHSSSCTVIEPRTELLSLAGYHRDPSLRTTAPLWGRRLAKSLHTVKRGERKWAEGEQVKEVKEEEKDYKLCCVRYSGCWRTSAWNNKLFSASLSFSSRIMEKRPLFSLLSFHQTHNCIHSAAC